MGSEKDGRLLETWPEHRKAIYENGATKTERMHERGSEDGGISGMTIAQDAFECSEEFQGQRARIFMIFYESGLIVVQTLYDANDWVCDPIV